MSTNCLVTKLKETVDNSNLKKLGVLKFRVNVPENVSDVDSYVSFNASSPLTIRIPEGKHITTIGGVQKTNVETFTPNVSGQVNFNLKDEGEYDVEILPKYEITGISNIPSASDVYNTVDLEDLKYCTLTKLSLSKYAKGDISNLLNSKNTLAGSLNLNDVSRGSENIKGTTDVLGQFTLLTTIRMERCLGISGELYKLANLTSLTLLDISYSNIGGSIEDYVAARLVATPATAGTLRLLATGTHITYEGDELNNDKYVDWDAQGNITLR